MNRATPRLFKPTDTTAEAIHYFTPLQIGYFYRQTDTMGYVSTEKITALAQSKRRRAKTTNKKTQVYHLLRTALAPMDVNLAMSGPPLIISFEAKHKRVIAIWNIQRRFHPIYVLWNVPVPIN